MGEPLLSVIIPVYNGEQYIDTIIDAFRKQTEKCFELIFIDDGSKDGSFEKISSYAGTEDFKITVHRQENAGVSVARNNGVAMASGRYITFVDSDDCIVPDYAEMLMKNADNGDFDVFVFQSLRVKENEPFVPQIADRSVKEIQKTDMLFRHCCNPTRLGVYNLFINRDFYREKELAFKAGYKYYEDYDFLYRAFAVADKILLTEYQMYFYILREGSAMARFNTDRLSCISILEDLKPCFKENVPEFLPIFEKWGISRIYWSIMWQASLAFSVSDARKFAKRAYIGQQMRLLRSFPDKKVKISSALFALSPTAFIAAAKILGRSHSKVKAVDIKDFDSWFDSQPQKILVYGMTDKKGGIEAYLMNMYRNIDRSKITFDFVVDWETMAFSDEVLAKGSEIHYIPAKGRHPLKQLIAFYRILKRRKDYKTVYFNILNAGGAFSMIVPFLMRRRIVTHAHSSSDGNMRLHRIFMKPLSLFTDVKLACSDLAARYMFGDKAVDRGEVTVINNAVKLSDYTFDSEKRAAKRAELRLGDEFTVMHAGRMSVEKNPMYLIDVFAEVLARNGNSVFLYAGTGPMEDEVKKYAEEKGVSQSVRFLGVRSDVSELMQAADVFLLPSKYEGLPVVSVEAQTADLQCFFSDRVSPDAGLTEKMHFLSIDIPASEWAEKILSADISWRKSREKEITDAGYNIENEAKRLEKALS